MFEFKLEKKRRYVLCLNKVTLLGFSLSLPGGIGTWAAGGNWTRDYGVQGKSHTILSLSPFKWGKRDTDYDDPSSEKGGDPAEEERKKEGSHCILGSGVFLESSPQRISLKVSAFCTVDAALLVPPEVPSPLFFRRIFLDIVAVLLLSILRFSLLCNCSLAHALQMRLILPESCCRWLFCSSVVHCNVCHEMFISIVFVCTGRLISKSNLNHAASKVDIPLAELWQMTFAPTQLFCIVQSIHTASDIAHGSGNTCSSSEFRPTNM